MLKSARPEGTFHNCAHTVMKVLKAVFYQNTPETLFPECIHEFIKSKE